MKQVVIRNIQTDVEYVVTQAEWERLKSNGHGKKFRVIRTIEARVVNVPDEVKPKTEPQKTEPKKTEPQKSK